MKPTIKLSLRIPPALHKQVKRRAQASNRSLNAVIVEAVQNGLANEGLEYESQEERAWKVLRESGIWEPLGPEWQKEIGETPDIAHEQLREMLRGVSPLSDLIIDERGPRE